MFSHGWPLTADAWEDQMLFLASRGFRCVAHDRRSHGRSGQPWDGNNMDTYADDLATLVQTLDLKNAVHVGHSTGGGEVARYIARHGTSRVAKAVLIGAVTPLMLKTAANPGGLPIDVFDGIRAGVLADRSQFFKDLTITVLRRESPRVEGVTRTRELVLLQGMLAVSIRSYDCIKAFSNRPTSDLKRFDIPTLIIHGDDDQIVPISASALQAAKLVKGATLKIYCGISAFVHRQDKINTDLLAHSEVQQLHHILRHLSSSMQRNTLTSTDRAGKQESMRMTYRIQRSTNARGVTFFLAVESTAVMSPSWRRSWRPSPIASSFSISPM